MRPPSIAVLLLALAVTTRAQEFEVVSVKPNNSLSGDTDVDSNQNLLRATNISLRSLIVRAYNLKNFQLEGPDWLGSEHFDITAKFPEAMPKGRDQYSAALAAMMQNMLLDRFKLRTHRTQKTFQIYGL